jgi:hypothetical protein
MGELYANGSSEDTWENYMKMDLKKTRRDCGLGEVAVSCGLWLVKIQEISWLAEEGECYNSVQL